MSVVPGFLAFILGPAPSLLAPTVGGLKARCLFTNFLSPVLVLVVNRGLIVGPNLCSKGSSAPLVGRLGPTLIPRAVLSKLATFRGIELGILLVWIAVGTEIPACRLYLFRRWLLGVPPLVPSATLLTPAAITMPDMSISSSEGLNA